MLQQSTYGRPYDYMYGGGSGSLLANVDFIVESGGDRVTGDDGAWLDKLDFIQSSDSGGGGAAGMDFIPANATAESMDFIPASATAESMDFISAEGGVENMDFIPADDGMDVPPPVIEAGLDVKVGNIKVGRPRLPRRNKTGKWYESKPGQTAKGTLPDGVHYMADAGLYSWTHYDREGKAHQRTAVKPPTPRQLRRSRRNFNRSRGLLGSGIGARSRPLDVNGDTGPKKPKFPGDSWGINQPPTDQPFTPATSMDDIPNILPYSKRGPAQDRPQQPAAESKTDQGKGGMSIPEAIASFKPSSNQPPENRAEIFAKAAAGDPDAMKRAAELQRQQGEDLAEIFAKAAAGDPDAMKRAAELQRQQGGAPREVKQSDMGVQGARTTAPGISRPDREYEFNWRVMELGEVTPSHNPATMQPNPEYPFEALQPRDRERASSERQVSKIARELRPADVLDDTHMIDMGPPIVGPEGAVESGSGRVMGIQRAAQMYPDRYKAYVEELRKPETLERVGLTAQQVEGIKRPVLVRERATELDPAERTAFAQEANAPRTMASSPTETAMQHADAFSDQELSRLDVPESASTADVLLSDLNRDIANRFIGSYPETQVAALADDEGRLNKRGVDAMREALFANVYSGVPGGKELSKELQENVDEDLQRLGQALQMSLPAVARSEALVRSGKRKDDYAIAGDIAAAVQTLRSLKRRQMPVENYLRSYTIDDEGLTPSQKRLLLYLAQNSQSPRKVSDFLTQYATFVSNQPDANQGGMMGLTPKPETKAQFIEARVPLPTEQQQVVTKDMTFKRPDEVRAGPLGAAAAIGKRRRQGLA